VVAIWRQRCGRLIAGKGFVLRMWVAGAVTPCTSERQASDHGALRLRAFYTCFGGVPCERGGASWPSADRQKNAKKLPQQFPGRFSAMVFLCHCQPLAAVDGCAATYGPGSLGARFHAFTLSRFHAFALSRFHAFALSRFFCRSPLCARLYHCQPFTAVEEWAATGRPGTLWTRFHAFTLSRFRAFTLSRFRAFTFCCCCSPLLFAGAVSACT